MELPQPTISIRVDYEGLWNKGPWCDVNVYTRERDGVTVVVATDRSNQHKNTSLTNRVERIMYLAWQRLGCPLDPVFVEHYDSLGHRNSNYSVVQFATGPDGFKTGMCVSAGQDVGPQFTKPVWRHVDLETMLKIIEGEKSEEARSGN